MKFQIGPAQFLEVPDSPEGAELLATLNAAWEANPLHRYFPHSKQEPFHASKARVKALIGGNRSGKSVAGGVDDLIQAIDRDSVPEHLLPYKKWEPPFHGRVITPDLGHTMMAVIDILKEWCPSSQLLDGEWDKAFDKTRRILRFKNGSHIDFMSYETDLDKFGGVALHRVRYDEEPPGEKGQAIRKAGQRRLIDYQGDEVWTFTPEFGLSWTHEALWENRGKEISERVWESERSLIVRATRMDNPNVPAFDESDKELTEEEYKVKVLGEYFHLKGLVFPEFKEQTHVVDAPKIEHLKGLDVLVGIDPGIRTSGIVFAAFDRDNSMLVFDELYLHDEEAIPENSAKLIRSKCKLWGVEPNFVIDPSARNRSLVNADNVEAAFGREGIFCTPGQNEVEAGIFELKRRMQHNPPVFHVSRDCEKFIWEVRRYRLNDKPGAFAVIKEHDHLLDPCRYLAQERAWWREEETHRPPKTYYQKNYQPPYGPLQHAPREYSPTGAAT